MAKSVNKYIWQLLLMALIFSLIGLTLIVFPQISLKVIAYIAAISMILFGISITFENEKNLFIINSLITGIISILLGTIVLVFPQLLITIVPIIIGTWMIYVALLELRITIILKKIKITSWLISFVLAIISILCGILLIVDPYKTAIDLTTILGLIILMQSIATTFNILIIRSNINEIVKKIK